jgi:hypothetical protein
MWCRWAADVFDESRQPGAFVVDQGGNGMRIPGSARICRVVIAGLLLSATGVTEAQWVLLGRKAVGVVRSLSQPHDGDRPGYDVATVVLDVDAEKVYRAVLAHLQANPAVAISAEDAPNLTVRFAAERQQGEIQVTPLREGYSELLVAASGAPAGAPSGTSTIVDGVLRVCEKVQVKCTVSPK